MQSSQSGGSHRKSKRGHFLTIKASIQKEDITLVNISASNVGVYKHTHEANIGQHKGRDLQ